MNQWIERYIYAVSKKLPASMREDVSKELRANIQDMIGDEPLKDAELSDLLHKLGHPNQLATSYRGKERYVIAPEYYDDYISALKLFGVIFVIVAFVTIPPSVFMDGWRSVAQALVSSLTNSFLNTFTWITIGFWIVGNLVKNEPSESWKLKDLPELPQPNQSKIKRGETIFELIFGLSFGLIFITWIQNGVPFLNMDVVRPFIIFFYISILLELIVGISKLIYGTWNYPIVFGTILQKIYDAGFAYFLLKSDFLNQEMYKIISENTSYSLQSIIDNVNLSKEVLMWIILLGTSISVITTLYKGFKDKR